MSPDDANTPSSGDNQTSPDLQTQARQELNQVSDMAKQELDAVTRRAAEDVRELGNQANAQMSKATDKAKSFAGDQKDFAAGQIYGVAAAITKVADELDGSDQQVVARYARDLAGGLSSMGKTIEDHDVDDLLGMAQSFGRQQPVAFLGAAALAGFVASRFALASSHRRETKGTGGAAGDTRPSGSMGSASSSGYGGSTGAGYTGSTGSNYTGSGGGTGSSGYAGSNGSAGSSAHAGSNSATGSSGSTGSGSSAGAGSSTDSSSGYSSTKPTGGL